MIENKNVEASKVNLNLSAVSNEEQSVSRTTTKIDYNATKAPKQTSVNLNRIFPSSSSKQTNKTSAKSNGVLSEEQKALITKAKTARQAQDNIMVGNVKAKIANNVVLEAKASYYESLAKYKDKRVTLTPTMKDTLKSAGKESVNAVQNVFASQDDVGSQTVGGIITATVMTTKALSTTKRATSAVESFVKNSPQTIKNAKEKIVKVGNKAYQIYGTADKMYLTIKQSLPLLKGGFVPMKNGLIANALKNGLHKTANIQRIIKLTKKIKKTYQTVKNTAKNVKNAYKYTINVIKVVAIDLKLKGGLTRGVLKNAKDKAKPLIFKAKVQGLKVVNAVSKKTAKTAVKGGSFLVKRGIPKGIKGVGGVINNVSSIMSSSDNEMIRGVGYSAKTVKYTVKTTATATKYTAKFVKTAPTKINNSVNKVKTATKKTVSTAKSTVKGVGNGIKFARKNGIKQAMKKSASKAKEKAARASYNAGKSVVNMIINVAKKAMGKMAIPAVAVLLLISVVSGGAGGLGSVVGYYLSGEFLFGSDNKYTVTDVETYLKESAYGIEYQREKCIKRILEERKDFLKKKPEEKKVILYTDYIGKYVDITDKDDAEDIVEDSFWSEDEIYNFIKPIFYAGLLAEYDLEPSKSQAKSLLEKLFKNIFTENYIDEGKGFCEQEHYCKDIHSGDDCFNYETVIHSQYTCERCCYYLCLGHPTYKCVYGTFKPPNHQCTAETGCWKVNYCPNKSCESGGVFVCSGSNYCRGHTVYRCEIKIEGAYDYLEEYFIDPIKKLEKKSKLSEGERAELSRLKDYYEICKAYIEHSSSP